MVNNLENRLELVKVITHFENKEFNEVCGIYECKFDGTTRVFIRHNDEMRIISFYVDAPIKEGIDIVTEKIKEVLLHKVNKNLGK